MRTKVSLQMDWDWDYFMSYRDAWLSAFTHATNRGFSAVI
jgi:hypothetical protein